MENKQNFIKTLNEFLNEQNDTYIETIKWKGKSLKLHKVSENPMKTLFYLDTMTGEPYMDINTIIDTNLLIDAIWVKIGGDEEKIADSLKFLEKTKSTTVSGYNRYVLYNIIN